MNNGSDEAEGRPVGATITRRGFLQLGSAGLAGVALLVCVARVHVGAHLPLDVVGGAALGVACACAVLLTGRAPVRT